MYTKKPHGLLFSLTSSRDLMRRSHDPAIAHRPLRSERPRPGLPLHLVLMTSMYVYLLQLPV